MYCKAVYEVRNKLQSNNQGQNNESSQSTKTEKKEEHKSEKTMGL